ncbi:MAG: murein biosynthesis integral membrane protein MurJ [Bdellovibrionaceae bacterium]|nr:murein biosynthesis integral membrane protein MurJ [Pseudobdellovibrionaceae bacterium]
MVPDPNKSLQIEAAQESRTRVVRSALRMAFGTLTSRSLGLVREMAFAALFDRAITDAWMAAFRLPNMFRRLLGEGSLSVSFIPVFIQAQVKDGEVGGGSSQAKALVDSCFTLLLVILTTLTVLGVMYPEPILRLLLDPEYVAQTEKFLLTVRMAQIMFGFVFLVSLYAFFMAILNALGIYGLPAMAPTLFNVAMITATLLPAAWFPWPGDGLAWGVIAGGFLQMVILIPALAKRGYLPRISFRWKSRALAQVLVNMGPGLIGLGLLQVTTLINMRFASSLGEGAISWIAWADRLLELPLSLVSVSLGTALLPTLAGHWAKGEKDRLSETLNFMLRLNLFVCFAAATGLAALAHPIVEVLFQRGQFTAADTAATAGVVQIWAMIMIPTACLRILAPAYYAIKNTWFPPLVSGVCLVAHILVAPPLMEAMGLTGLNLSSLLSSSLNFLLLFVFYRAFIGPLGYGKLLVQTLKYLVPMAALFGAVQIHGPLRDLMGGAFPSKVLALSVAVIAGALAYAIASRTMGLEEWNATAERVLKKLRRRV